MCGIAGIAGPGAGGPDDVAAVRGMLRLLVHRGPDDEGVLAGDGFVLGARRLAVTDVAGGRQPLATDDGAVAVAMNGELYGAAAARAALEARGARFRTRCDTEVALAAFAADGAACLPRLDGMFALAAWDGRARALTLARDALGEKPLVWFAARGRVVFASELRALAAHPDAPRALDADALALGLLHRYVPAPWTPWRGVRRLPPGHVLVARAGAAPTVAPWWELPVPAAAPGRLEDAADDVRARLDAAVGSRLAADVPVGVFLSGGLDSAAVAALAARRGPVATFTLRTADPEFDEGAAARATAAAVGAAHHELVVDDAALAAGVDAVLAHLDEPLGDPSLVPTLLLAREARRHVKVVLGGEGADELFGGYPTYLGARWAGAARALPGPLRRGLAGALGGGRPRNVGSRWLLRRLLEGAALAPLERHLEWLGGLSPTAQAALWRPEARPAVVGDALYGPVREAAAPAAATGDPVDALLRADLRLHLPDALLAKVDRATSAASLEARAPFLERGLVEAAARMPAAWKVGRARTKLVLRRALEGVVPAAVLRRRKRGFGFPVARALAGPLGARLEALLHDGALGRSAFRPAPVLGWLAAHRAGRADHARRLWPLLTLLAWADRFAPGRAVT